MSKQLDLITNETDNKKESSTSKKIQFKKSPRKKGLKSMKDLLYKWQFDPDRMKSQKYVKHEFQDYGVRLAHKLDDMEHKSLYIKLAKSENRERLEQAYRFAIDYPNMDGKNKGRLFMWVLSKLRRGETLEFPDEKKSMEKRENQIK
jgi:hypothetical protein